jgi:hypothetical protein
MKSQKHNNVMDDQLNEVVNHIPSDTTLIKSDFKLIGLSRKRSMTCEPLDNENIFWPTVGLTQDRFDALWDYFQDQNL